jgi:methylenetetrahydrofolate reductase (NADPH)
MNKEINRLDLAIQGKTPAITAELSLRSGAKAAELLRQASELNDAVDGLLISENPFSWTQMSPIAAAGLLRAHGMQAIPRLHCRDRNRIALKSDLLGLQALGVNSLVLNKGNRIPAGHELHAKAVFDVSCREFIMMAAAMNEVANGDENPGFLLGTGAKVFVPPPDWSAEMMQNRASAGARFLQTQLCMDMTILRAYMQALVKTQLTWRYAVFVTMAPLPSADTARWLLENSPDCLLSPGILERLAIAHDPVQEGIAICAEQMAEAAEIPGVSGFNLLSLGNPEAVLRCIDQSGIRVTTS